MNTLRSTSLIIFLLILMGSTALATPCFKKKKLKGIQEESSIVLNSWMFDNNEWETGERVYLKSWMYSIPPLNEYPDFLLKPWMTDLTSGWPPAGE